MSSEDDGTGPVRRSYAKGIRRREEILAKTMDVFLERGFEGTTLRAIGEAIGVSHAALRHYFPSREALLLEVLRRRDEAGRPPSGAEGGVFEEIAAGADRNARAPGLVALYTAMLAGAVEEGNETSRAYFAERFRTGRAAMALRLREEAERRREEGGGAAGPPARPVDMDRLAALVYAAWDGLQIQWLLDPDVDIVGGLMLLERLLDDGERLSGDGDR